MENHAGEIFVTMDWKYFRAIVLAGVLLAGCTPNGATAQPAAAVGSAPQAGQGIGGEVVLYSGREESLVAPLLLKFAAGANGAVRRSSTRVRSPQ